MREGSESQTAGGGIEDVGGDETVAGTPCDSRCLVAGHGRPCFAEGGDRQGSWKSEGSAWRRLEEDLVLGRDGAVFVAVAATLANVLFCGVNCGEFVGELGRRGGEIRIELFAAV